MWAGGTNYLYPYRIFTTEPYNLHTYAEWVIDSECYSYQKCLIFETKRPQEHPYSPSSGLNGTIEDCLDDDEETYESFAKSFKDKYKFDIKTVVNI